MKKLRTVGIIVECKGEILILHRNPDRPQGNTWGLPAGKVELGEEDLGAAIRELFEETGYKAKVQDLIFVDNFNWHFPKNIIFFPTFKLILKKKFAVRIDSKEHQGYEWISPEKCYQKENLIHGFYDLLEKIYNINSKK